jgi:hypothetical protein
MIRQYSYIGPSWSRSPASRLPHGTVTRPCHGLSESDRLRPWQSVSRVSAAVGVTPRPGRRHRARPAVTARSRRRPARAGGPVRVRRPATVTRAAASDRHGVTRSQVDTPGRSDGNLNTYLIIMIVHWHRDCPAVPVAYHHDACHVIFTGKFTDSESRSLASQPEVLVPATVPVMVGY